MTSEEASTPDDATAAPDPPPIFTSAAFRGAFDELMMWRRDVRSFTAAPVPAWKVEALVRSVEFAPSVGLSQPARLVDVSSSESRAAVFANFEQCNQAALAGYDGDRALRYSQLKLQGLQEAPVQLAVFCDSDTVKGSGLGRRTMPAMLQYSVVTAVHSLWLTAGTLGLGVGWVSILDEPRLKTDLNVPASWELIAYLCVGEARSQSLTPERERSGWERRSPTEVLLR